MSKQRSTVAYVWLVLKGMAMGAADVVPGVSGGTIAFISGIYDELLESINAVGFDLIKVFKNEGIKGVWQKINGNFLVALFSGILISIISLAKILSYWLKEEPVLVWSFFFGLVIASIFYVGKQVKHWNIKTIIALLFGITIAYLITSLSPTTVNQPTTAYIVMSGAIAICAMILPGISGSFILVLLGVYALVLDAVHLRKLDVIVWLGLGAVFGLLTFSRLLKYLLNKYRDLTLAILTGIIVGSLNKIWPWKEVIEQKIIEDRVIVLKDQSVLPTQYDGDPQLLLSLVLAVVGFTLIIILEKWAQKTP